jgi:S-adenosylmethionine decarboxylase
MIKIQRLIIEGHGCAFRSLNRCADFVTMLIATIKVHELMRQQVEATALIPGRELGVTVSVSFLESHLFMQTWPEENFVDLEISSCKSFDRELIIKAFQRFFEPDFIVEIL